MIRAYLKREAVLSSKIEGTLASLEDLNKHEAVGNIGKSESENLRLVEVLNYVGALEHSLEKIKEISKEEVSTETISGFCNIRDKKCYNNNDSNSFEEEPKDLAVEQQKRVNAKETMPRIVNTHYTL